MNLNCTRILSSILHGTETISRTINKFEFVTLVEKLVLSENITKSLLLFTNK